MRGWDRGQRDEVEKVGGRKKRGVNNEMWMLLHHSRGLSFVSAGGQEIPLLLLQVGAQGPEGSARADTWSGSVHNKRTYLHGDIQTDMEGSRGQVLDLWSLTGLIHTHTQSGLSLVSLPHFKDCNKGQTLACLHRTLDGDKPLNTWPLIGHLTRTVKTKCSLLKHQYFLSRSLELFPHRHVSGFIIS